MTRSIRRANNKHAKAKREIALSRIELGRAPTPRVPAAGVTSMGIKVVAPADRALSTRRWRKDGSG